MHSINSGINFDLTYYILPSITNPFNFALNKMLSYSLIIVNHSSLTGRANVPVKWKSLPRLGALIFSEMMDRYDTGVAVLVQFLQIVCKLRSITAHKLEWNNDDEL